MISDIAAAGSAEAGSRSMPIGKKVVIYANVDLSRDLFANNVGLSGEAHEMLAVWLVSGPCPGSSATLALENSQTMPGLCFQPTRPPLGLIVGY